jgi:hypothetical protein
VSERFKGTNVIGIVLQIVFGHGFPTFFASILFILISNVFCKRFNLVFGNQLERTRESEDHDSEHDHEPLYFLKNKEYRVDQRGDLVYDLHVVEHPSEDGQTNKCLHYSILRLIQDWHIPWSSVLVSNTRY